MNLYIGILILLLLAAAVFFEIWRETHHFKVTHYQVESGKISSQGRALTILFLSDLHSCVYGENNSKLVEAVKKEAPDLILIGGDMLIGKENASGSAALDFVKRLPGICPVYYANGNHEQRMKEDPDGYRDSYAEYQRELKERGVHFLENHSQSIWLGENELVISGLELPSGTYKKFQKSSVTSRQIAERVGRPDRGRSGNAYTILLAHNPAYMDAYLEWGADLILSGHLHGGLVRFPLVGGVVTPQGFLFPKYSGELTRVGDQTVIVSRGLGSHTINVRFFNTPEIVSIRLCAKEP